MIIRIVKWWCILSCFIVVAYLFGIAQERYVCRSQFSIVVKDSTGVEASAGFLNLLGAGSGSNDTQSAIGFIHSADLLLKIEKEFDLATHFSSPKKDIIFKLSNDASLEERLEYYRKRIIASLSKETGLIILEVESFSAELSYEISTKILSETKEFINRLNHNIAQERLGFVELEIGRAKEKISLAKQELINFQNKHRIISPEPIFIARLERIQMLQLEKTQKDISLTALRSASPSSPNIKSLETEIATIQYEIKKIEDTLSGEENSALNKMLAEFNALQLELQFSLKLKTGLDILMEKTRSEALSTSRFFSVIQNPYIPEKYERPRRLYYSISWVVLILIFGFIAKGLVDSILDRTS